MAKVRVYELARELGRDNKTLEETIRSLGIEIKNYMSTLTPEDADRVRSTLRGGKEDSPVEKRIRPTVIRRRAVGVRRRRAEADEDGEEAPAEDAEVSQTAPVPAVVRRPTIAAAPEPEPAPPPPKPAPKPRVAEVERPRAAPAPPPAPAPVRPAPAAEVPTVAEAATEPAGLDVDVDVDAVGEDGEEAPVPAVGTRIALPKGTRRLPGGLAGRMGGPPREGEDEEALEPEGEPDVSVPAPAPVADQTPAPTAIVEAAAAAEAAPAPAEQSTGRRVLRNEDGVIVGAASQRSEPKILGFIPLEQRRKRQQVIITDASEEDRRGRASQRKQREERAQAQGRRKKMMRSARGRSQAAPTRTGTVEMSEAKKRIRVDEAIQVSDLAHQMGQKASNVLKVLWGMGLRGITINHAIDHETTDLVAAEFGYSVENVSFQEDEFIGIAEASEGEPRAPVVTIMGHVDHGKTSLLDKIREARVAAGEAGGITQHIGAYRVVTPKGDVVFLDTPGHEAFTAMRARGAQTTDVIVLVVAADDGVMPTTVEAIKHANEASVPVIVAINKIDKPDANSGRVKQGLMEHALIGEEFGGDTIICEVSAKTGQGVTALLEMLALQTEMLTLRAPVEGRAKGVVIEARVDKGRGPVATVLIEAGTLKNGDIVVANEVSGKVRGLFDDHGKKLKQAGPSTPVEILGLDGVPSAGDSLHVVESDKDAKQLVSHRREQRRRKESVRTGPSIQELIKRKRTATLKIVLRADVQGSAEAIKDSFEELSTEKVKVEVIKAEVGAINETDVKYAHASDAIVIGFNVKTAGKAAPAADADNVSILTFNVIYDALDKVRELMVGLLEPEYREKEQGEAEVRALFPIPRLGVVAGCRVLRGLVQRSSRVRVVREGEVIHRGEIASLRVFKDDVREVKEGFECGIVVAGYPDVQAGDTIQAFELETIQPTL